MVRTAEAAPAVMPIDARLLLPLIDDARAEAMLEVVSPDCTVLLAVWLPPGRLSFSIVTETTSPTVTVPPTVAEVLPFVLAPRVRVSVGFPTIEYEYADEYL